MTMREAEMDDSVFMDRALALAAHSPLPDPNPRVGCVLVHGAEIVGEGWHQGAGTPHAEVAALTAAGTATTGATAYVTLEPCQHTGLTGPCTQALLKAGVTRVVYGADDPNPLAGGGAATLRAAGIEIGRARIQEATDLNHIWNRAIRQNRPVVTWKAAMTLDGRTAAADGTSQWITGPAARADVHALRAQVGAIIVGTGTALHDDPQLTVRDAEGIPAARQPLRVVVGSTPLPPSAKVLDTAAPTLLLSGSPAEVLAELAERGIRHVLLEGGATLAAAFLRAGLVDEIVTYVAPMLLADGVPLVHDLGITTLTDAPRYYLRDVAQIGGDVRIRLSTHSSEEEYTCSLALSKSLAK